MIKLQPVSSGLLSKVCQTRWQEECSGDQGDVYPGRSPSHYRTRVGCIKETSGQGGRSQKVLSSFPDKGRHLGVVRCGAAALAPDQAAKAGGEEDEGSGGGGREFQGARGRGLQSRSTSNGVRRGAASTRLLRSGRISWSVRWAARVHHPAWSGGARSDSEWWRWPGTGTREGLTDLVIELVVGAGYALSVRRLPYLFVDPAHLVLVVS